MEEHACTQEDRITRIEGTVTAIDGKLDAINTNQAKIMTCLDIYMKKVDEHDAILKGENGDVGVVAKVAQAVDILDELKIALKGKEDKPGLIAAIDVLVKRAASTDDDKVWLRRLIIGTVITWMLGIGLMIFK